MSEERTPSVEKEHVQLTLRPKDESQGEGVIERMLADLRESLPGMLTDLSGSGRRWVRGKSDQEVARAREILSHAIERIGRLALDEREQIHRQQLETSRQEVELQARQTDMYLTALERAIRIARELSDMGVDVDVKSLLTSIPDIGKSLQGPGT